MIMTSKTGINIRFPFISAAILAKIKAANVKRHKNQKLFLFELSKRKSDAAFFKQNRGVQGRETFCSIKEKKFCRLKQILQKYFR